MAALLPQLTVTDPPRALMHCLPDRRRRAGFKMRGPATHSEPRAQEQPLVAPQLTHFRHEPLRTIVKLPQPVQASPS